ncbi:MAG: hypothetical protein FWH38_05805, partial [Treponema sp.]|nr:hypothetical protein [Treponema sp.]
MKRFFVVLMAVLMIAAVFTGCKGKSDAQAPAAGRAAADIKEITLISNKIEIDEPLKAYAAVYERQT